VIIEPCFTIKEEEEEKNIPVDDDLYSFHPKNLSLVSGEV
jgi:hypothetical protein